MVGRKAPPAMLFVVFNYTWPIEMLDCESCKTEDKMSTPVKKVREEKWLKIKLSPELSQATISEI